MRSSRAYETVLALENVVLCGIVKAADIVKACETFGLMVYVSMPFVQHA